MSKDCQDSCAYIAVDWTTCGRHHLLLLLALHNLLELSPRNDVQRCCCCQHHDGGRCFLEMSSLMSLIVDRCGEACCWLLSCVFRCTNSYVLFCKRREEEARARHL